LGGTAALLMVALGVTTNQVLNNQAWSWAWFAAAVLCALATVVVGQRTAGLDRRCPTLRLVDEDGRPPRLSDVTPRQLGVHPSRFGTDGDSPYIDRDVDGALADIVRAGPQRLVVVQGPRLAGTTSTLAQIAQAHLPDHRVLVFADDPRFGLIDMVAESRRWVSAGQEAVLWLDDLNESRLGQLDASLLEGLPDGLWILATIHDKHLTGLRIPEHVRQLLEEGSTGVRIGTVSPREQDDIRAEETYAALRTVLHGSGEWLMGRLMVALDQVQDALMPAVNEESADRIALLRAVTDWSRLAIPDRLTRPVLKELYNGYLGEASGRDGDISISATRFGRALKWAMVANSSARPQLVDQREAGRTSWYTPNPLLGVVADDVGQPGAWPVGEALWDYADRKLAGDQRRDIGYTALDRGAFSQARQLLGHDDTQVEATALHRVAERLHQTGETSAARLFYGKVIGTGHKDQAVAAMINLGALEAAHGSAAEARRWFGEAAASKHSTLAPKAMFNLGRLESDQGDFAEARRWWRDTVAAGNPDLAAAAMVNLGELESRHGDAAEARRWWRDAVTTGHHEAAPAAMANLGIFESERGNAAEARRWLKRAADTSHPDHAPRAMINLGLLEASRGNTVAAGRWLRRVADSENPEHAPKAMVELGLAASKDGDLGGARRWWQAAVDSGHPNMAPVAMGNLGVAEYQAGNLEEAGRWWRAAAATGDPEDAPKAMVLLGVLEARQGNTVAARRWLQEAIGTGHADHGPAATINLGVLEADLHNLDASRRLWQQVVATGHPKYAPNAMLNLGGLEIRAGHPEEARLWMEKVVRMGQPETVATAKRELQELDRNADALRKADHFSKYGWQARADLNLMKPDDPVKPAKAQAKQPSSRRRRPPSAGS